MASVFVNWQDENRAWHTVAKLWKEGGEYCFAYTEGARRARNFQTFGGMTRIGVVYRSESLFPLFSNRILARSRSDYESYLSWMSLSSSAAEPLDILGRSGGYRATDGIQLYMEPVPTAEGKYQTSFFVHGMRYTQASSAGESHLKISVGERIFPMLDICNEFDDAAVALRTSEPYTFLGYCPRYLASDIGSLAKNSGSQLRIVVVRFNREAPLQMRLFCQAEAFWPEGFAPCSSFEYQLANEAP